MTSCNRVKETKRQGRIAHHHTDATVPHIVALPGFSFHAAKIRIIPLPSKQISIYFIFFLKIFLCFKNILYFCNQVLANRRDATLLRQKAAVE